MPLSERVAQRKAQQEQQTPTLRRNPEIDAKLDRFIGENPKLREYYDALPKEELIRKLMLGKMQQREYAEGRNNEIRSWVEQHPEITFTSTNVERDGDDWTITGDLTVKGITKSIAVEFESTGSARDPFGNLRIGFEGHTTLSRKDWGLTWNAALETGGFLVSDKIKLDFDISAIQN